MVNANKKKKNVISINRFSFSYKKQLNIHLCIFKIQLRLKDLEVKIEWRAKNQFY